MEQQLRNKVKEAAKLATPQIIVSNIVKLLISVRNKVIPKNTTIGLLGLNGRIIGNIDDFMNGEDFQDWENNRASKVEADVNYKDFASQKGVMQQMGNEWDRLNTENARETAAKQVAANPYQSAKQSAKMIKGKYDEIFDVHEAPGELTEDVTIPNNNVTGDNKSDQKLEQQKQQLKEQDRKQKEAQQQAQQSQQGGQNGGNITLNPKTPSNLPQPANQMDVHKVNMSNSQSIGINN